MKVVINKCFGGFGLSPLAIKRVAELKGVPCYFFKTEYRNHKAYHIPVDMDEVGNSLFFSAYTVPNPDEYMNTTKEWQDMTHEERTAHNQKWDEITLDSRYDDRTDKLLIQVVEELGAKASGGCADLKIIEVPDDVEWEISEYDGLEHIAEKHQTWG